MLWGVLQWSISLISLLVLVATERIFENTTNSGNNDRDIKIVFIISAELVPVQTPKNLKFCRFYMSFGDWVYILCRLSHFGKKYKNIEKRAINAVVNRTNWLYLPRKENDIELIYQ